MSLPATALRALLPLAVLLCLPGAAQAADTSAPVIEWIEMEPRVVNVTDATADVLVTARVTDETGVVAASFFQFRDGVGDLGEGSGMRLISGSQTDGIQQTTITIPQGTPEGDYLLDGSFEDAGGYRTAGFPDAFDRAVSVDSTVLAAVQTTINAKPAASITDRTPTFVFSSSEPRSTFECSRDDGVTWSPCASPTTLRRVSDGGPLPNGSYTFAVRATDATGEQDPTPATASFVVVDDLVPPETVITAGPDELVAVASATFAFSSPEEETTYECSLDGAPWVRGADCASPKRYTALSDGPHRFQVRAVDVEGNVDPDAAEYRWVLDTTAPDTAIDAGPSGTITESTVVFDVSSEPGALFKCSLDQAEFVLCDPPITHARLGDGPHTFEVRALDLAGNADATPAARSFSVVAPPPFDQGFTPADRPNTDPLADESGGAGGAGGPPVGPGPSSGSASGSVSGSGPVSGSGSASGSGSGSAGGTASGASRKRCKAPRLRGKTLPAARKALTKAGCRLGKVSKPKKIRRGTTLVVARQSGTTRIAVTLGAKPRPKKR